MPRKTYQHPKPAAGKPAPPPRRLTLVEAMQLREFDRHLMAHGASKAQAYAASSKLPIGAIRNLLPWPRRVRARWKAWMRADGGPRDV